jgi:hypothetical protein
MMAESETDDHALRVDDHHLIRQEPPFLLRLAGLGVSLAVIAGVIYWASTV